MQDIKNITPVMQQYLDIKNKHLDAIVLFRLGDFYEMFFDDAIIASKTLEISLTSRSNNKNIPMCGIPFHALKIYLKKLLDKGLKVAICDQVVEPNSKLATRRVSRVVTPGTVIESDILSEKNNNFVASITLDEAGYILAYIDISTAEAYIYPNLSKDHLISSILTLKIKEIIGKKFIINTLQTFFEENNIYYTVFDDYQLRSLKAIVNLDVACKKAASHLLNYVIINSNFEMKHLQDFVLLLPNEYMNVSNDVKKHLEIFECMNKEKGLSLINLLDNTKTSMGSRKLKHILNYPIKSQLELEKRYALIEAFSDIKFIDLLNKELIDIYDISRIITLMSYKTCNARDLVMLKKSLLSSLKVKQVMKTSESVIIAQLEEKLPILDNVIKLLDDALNDEDLPLSIKEGGFIKTGYNNDVDRLRNLVNNSNSLLKTYEEELKEITQIKNLKISYTRAFGYYIEVSKSSIGFVKPEFEFIRKQTLTTSERYITQKLKSFEEEILSASQKVMDLEYALFDDIRITILDFIPNLQQLAQTMSLIDVYANVAHFFIKNNYVKPIFSTDKTSTVIKGRHPIVEKTTNFIKNDVQLNNGEIYLLTGPNMSGKSTYMRMYSLIAYLAQVGLYVPAQKVLLPIYDAIYTRIGSSDDIASGKSTFMVEMLESADALINATSDSLLIFDEIGRGTSTYDGMALAYGIIKHIALNIGCQMMFSTHYHELTQLDKVLANVTNMYVTAKETSEGIKFFHTVKKGTSDKSYGLQVAALANMPHEVLTYAKVMLKEYEGNNQQDLFNLDRLDGLEDSFKKVDDIKNGLNQELLTIKTELLELSLDEITGLDALIILKNFKNKL